MKQCGLCGSSSDRSVGGDGVRAHSKIKWSFLKCDGTMFHYRPFQFCRLSMCTQVASYSSARRINLYYVLVHFWPLFWHFWHLLTTFLFLSCGVVKFHVRTRNPSCSRRNAYWSDLGQLKREPSKNYQKDVKKLSKTSKTSCKWQRNGGYHCTSMAREWSCKANYYCARLVSGVDVASAGLVRPLSKAI